MTPIPCKCGKEMTHIVGDFAYCDECFEKKGGSVELTIFEENLTADGLAKIEEEAKTWPAVASNKQDYDLIYEQHQRFKRLRIACTKKASELIKIERESFKKSESKIKHDLAFVMRILVPLEHQLLEARTEWDNAIETKKKEKADALALEQKIEFERQEAEREIIRLAQKEEADRLKAEADRLKTQDDAIKASKEKLDRERREFEIEKGRLSFDEAWEAAWAEIPLGAAGCSIIPWVTGSECEDFTKNETLKNIIKPTEKAAEELNKLGIKDPGGIQAGIDLAKVTANEAAANLGKSVKENFTTSADRGFKTAADAIPKILDSVSASLDPAEKEKQLIKEDREKIDLINVRIAFLIEYFTLCQEEGFQSKTATTELYRLVESIKEADARFKENLTSVEKVIPSSNTPQKEA